MKTIKNIRYYIAAFTILFAATYAFGQRTTSGEQSRNTRTRSIEYRQPKERSREANSNNRKYTVEHTQKRGSDRNNEFANRNREYVRDYTKNNNRQHSYNHKNSYEKKHDHYEKPHHSKKVVVYRTLPKGNMHHFQHNGHEYYHCNNKFFVFYPGYGYVLARSPFTIVRYLPRYYYFRDYYGHRHAFAHGYYYIPYGDGFMMIPERVNNSFTLSLSF